MASRMSTCLPLRRAKSGPSSCEISCIRVGGKIPFRRGLRGLAGLHQLPRDRQHDVSDPGVHEILEEDLLRPFLLMDARIVGEIVGHRLVAMPQIARRDTARPSPPSASDGRASKAGRRRPPGARPVYPAHTSDRPRGAGSPLHCGSAPTRRKKSSRRADRRDKFRKAQR